MTSRSIALPMNLFTTGLCLILSLYSGIITSQETSIYDLGAPTRKVELGESLRELSGIACYKGQICAIQDEKGRIYFLDPDSGVIIHEDKFWGKGDFEDIAIVGDRVFVIKSNGNIYESDINSIDEEMTKKYDLGFDSDWNFEGMTYDEANNGLLITAKRKSSASEKEIYLVPLDNMYLVIKPIHVIKHSELSSRVERSKKSWSDKLAASLGDLTYSFNPSAISIHPIDGEIYVVSSPVPQLAIYSPDWELRKVILLDPDMYKQPESICFDSAGNLYIGNEGRNSKANILKFTPQ